MRYLLRLRVLLIALACVLCGASIQPNLSPASDHDDTPLLKTAPRHDARVTDLFAFTRDNSLVLAMCLDPMIPPSVTQYNFAADLTVKMHIDNGQTVRYDNPQDVSLFGGTILNPQNIRPRITFTFTFDNAGQPKLVIDGLNANAQSDVQVFTGLRDDPFIRGPRIGRNSAALVVQLPLAHVVNGNRALLIWGTSHVDDFMGPFQDLGGRSLRSQFVENDALNIIPPRQHHTDLHATPDVVIFDTTRPAAFPNGRELTDDVVDLVGDPRVLANDAPFPTANDVPFLTTFPYLAAPHAP